MVDQNVDVLIMTALGKEHAAVMAHSTMIWEQGVDEASGIQYFRAELPNGIRVALAGTTNTGPVSAALATTHAITALRPSRIVLAGIAAGIGDGVALGDIVVSDQIVDYDAGKVESGVYAPRWRAYPADPVIVNLARNQQPSISTVAGPLLHGRPDGLSRLPKVHVGTVLAGSKVVADAEMIDSLRATWSQAVGLEMEGGGGASAAHEHPLHPRFILVKGVCDRADSEKNDVWQEYAARAAALYTLGLLLAMGRADVVRARPEPKPKHERRRPADQFEVLGTSAGQVQTMLKAGFSTEDLMALCVTLDIDWDDLQGTAKTGKVASIVAYGKKRRLIEALMQEMKEMNPRIFEPLPDFS